MGFKIISLTLERCDEVAERIKNIFDGVSNVGIVDMEIFREVYPDHYFIDTAAAQKTVPVGFAAIAKNSFTTEGQWLPVRSRKPNI